MRSKPTSFVVVRIASHVTSAFAAGILDGCRDRKRFHAVALPEICDRLFDRGEIAGALRARGHGRQEQEGSGGKRDRISANGPASFLRHQYRRIRIIDGFLQISLRRRGFRHARFGSIPLGARAIFGKHRCHVPGFLHRHGHAVQERRARRARLSRACRLADRRGHPRAGAGRHHRRKPDAFATTSTTGSSSCASRRPRAGCR